MGQVTKLVLSVARFPFVGKEVSHELLMSPEKFFSAEKKLFQVHFGGEVSSINESG